ncbi:MAG: MerR family transcriptional regulator [Candidatus Omnitrophica bacterium]|nr:MerR family transcriptional regulator [Candidatus Omnitrophota bacterium]
MSWRKVKNIGMTEAIKKIGVSAERLRYWELKGVIKPGYAQQGAKRVRRYSKNDVDIAKEIRKLIEEEGYTLKGAAERLNCLYNGG